MKKLWKAISERILAGERDEKALAGEVVAAILDSRALTKEWVSTTVATHIRGMVADRGKPAGKTSRTPAGQQGMPWAELDARIGYDALRRNVKRAYAKMARARIEAEIIGVVDASGLDIDTFDKLGDLCVAAGVPDELLTSLAA